MSPATWEIERKYRLADPHEVRRRAAAGGAVYVRTEEHVDEYLAHPCRDLRNSDEAFRIRRLDGQRWLTYKGPRQGGPTKIREEIECELSEPADAALRTVLQRLGFHTARLVRKTREVWALTTPTGLLHLAFDSVPELGEFLELEIVAEAAEREAAAAQVAALAATLDLREPVEQSYLGMLLAADRNPAAAP